MQFFFDDLVGASERANRGVAEADREPFVLDFVSSAEGLALNRAYVKIKDPKLRRRVLDLVRQMAADDEVESD